MRHLVLCYNRPMQELVLPALRSALGSVGLLRRDAQLLAGVSGGADSVALVLGLAALREEAGFSLTAVHVNHGLRGESAREDEAFVCALCRRLNVPLFCCQANLEGDMNTPGVEDRARQVRRQWFAEAMARAGGDALLLGHHRDDQAETVLMRLLRGAGTRGLSGMREAAPFGGGLLLRPFLALPRQALLEALGRAGQPWREDESNQCPCTLRNRLRLEVLPLLNELQPQASRHMAETARRMAVDEDCLQALAARRLRAARVPFPGSDALRAVGIAEAPKALGLRMLRHWAEEGMAAACAGGERALSDEDTLALWALATGEKTGARNLPGGLRAVHGGQYLHLQRQDGTALCPAPMPRPIPVASAMETMPFGPVCFSLTAFGSGEGVPDGKRAVLLTGDLLSAGLWLRAPKPGDRMRPFGAPGSKELRRYWTDHKVDPAFRAGWPVLALGHEVLWVPGVGASEGTRVDPGAQEPFWKLSLQGELPT